jgi:hypothetical protein
MAFARPFTYNPGTSIPGTEQVGSLAIGTPTSGFTNNPQFWNGPDEELGYVIAAPVSGNTQPTEIPGVFASLGFYGTSGFSDSDFINLSQAVSSDYGTPQTFSSATDASVWLTNNGFWNSFISVTPTPTGTLSVTSTPTTTSTPTPSVTNTQTPTPTPTGTPANTGTPTPTPTPTSTPQDTLIDPIITENDEYIEVGNNEYLMFVDPVGPSPTPTETEVLTPTPTETPTPTPTGTETPTNTPTPTNTETPTNTPTPTATSVTPTPTPTSGASGNFNVLVSQVGPDVVWSGSGSFNLTSLTLNQNIPGVTGGFNQPFAQFIIGPTSPSGATTYSGSSFTTFPTSFGSGGGLAPSSSSGSLFGVVQTAGPSGPREVVVPPGYVSGTVISGSMTYNTQTIAGMGLSGGTYTWAWGSGGTASTLVMTIENVGVTPTPTPTSTSTPTNTPTPSPTPLPTIYTNGTVLGTCSDYCTTNYNITTVTSADNSYASLTIGDFIYGISGAGFIAYSNVSTNTTTGPFQIAEINSSGEILGLYFCNGSICDPL